VFGCVRALIFAGNSDFPAVPGTGFLLKLFGEIFFVTARHAVDNHGFDLRHLAVTYSEQNNRCIPFDEVRTFSSVDPDDTDHVDIIVLKANSSKLKHELFASDLPFDFTADAVVRVYQSGMLLHFKGVAPEQNDFDYENKKYTVEYAAGDMYYEAPTSSRAVHLATAKVNRDCPDFDGMSGSPVFWVANIDQTATDAKFAGMLLRGARKNSILHFMEAECVTNFLLGFFLDGLTPVEAEAKIENLLKWHLPDIGRRYRSGYIFRYEQKWMLPTYHFPSNLPGVHN
jgi:hypothetical protein